MALTLQHRTFAEHYAETRNGVFSAQKAYPNQSKKSAAVTATRLLKKIEIFQLVDKLETEKNRKVLQLENEYLDETKKKTISDIETDYLLSQIVRGEVAFEKLFKVNEYIPAYTSKDGKVIPAQSITTFKKILCSPSIMDRINAANTLYKRKNSYKHKGPCEAYERDFVILADGRKCYIDTGEIVER